MKYKNTTVLVLAIGAFINSSYIHAEDEYLTDYETFISPKDFRNSKGELFTKVSEVIQQDRANAHKFGNPDGDDLDAYFTTADRRSEIPEMLAYGEIAPSILNSIKSMKSTSVHVVVWTISSGRRVIKIHEVEHAHPEPDSTTEAEPEPERMRPAMVTTSPQPAAGVAVGDGVSNPGYLHFWNGKVIEIRSSGAIVVRLTYVADSSINPSDWRSGSEVTLTPGEYRIGARGSLGALGGGR